MKEGDLKVSKILYYYMVIFLNWERSIIIYSLFWKGKCLSMDRKNQKQQEQIVKGNFLVEVITKEDTNYVIDELASTDFNKESSILLQIPAVLEATYGNDLGEDEVLAYKVSMEEGIQGTLDKYKENARLLPALRKEGRLSVWSKDKKLGINETKQALAATLFEEISTATGQYFITQMKRRLRDEEFVFRGMEKLLVDEVVSSLLADFQFLSSIQSDYSYILKDNGYRTATLTNIQACIRDADKYLLMSQKIVSRYIDKINYKRNINDMTLDVKDFVGKLKLSYLALEVYSAGKTMETLFSGNYEEEYLSKTIHCMKEKEEYFSKFLDESTDALKETFTKMRIDRNDILSFLLGNHSLSFMAAAAFPIGGLILLSLMGPEEYNNIKKKYSDKIDELGEDLENQIVLMKQGLLSNSSRLEQLYYLHNVRFEYIVRDGKVYMQSLL